MRNETKMKVLLGVAGVALLGGGVLIGRATKGEDKDSSDLHEKVAIESARADSAEANVKTLVIEKDSLANGWALANDSIIVLNDRVAKTDSLQHANDSIVHANGLIMAELEDCKASKNAGKNSGGKNNGQGKSNDNAGKTSTVSTASEQSKQSAAIVPVQPVENPQEPVVQHQEEPVAAQEPEQITSGSTTVNVNTPNNVINISNGGVINNYAQDTKCTEQQCIEEYKKAQQAYQDGFVPTGRRVRCK